GKEHEKRKDWIRGKGRLRFWIRPYFLSPGAGNDHCTASPGRKKQHQPQRKRSEKNEGDIGERRDIISKTRGKDMKILIVSDTHGHERNLKKVIEKVGQTDLFIHLGDIDGHEDYIEALAYCPVHMVSGNNDFFSDLPREEEFQLGRYHVLITHGHYYGVSVGTDRLKEEACSRNIDIVMYGHTHRPEIDIDAKR